MFYLVVQVFRRLQHIANFLCSDSVQGNRHVARVLEREGGGLHFAGGPGELSQKLF